MFRESFVLCTNRCEHEINDVNILLKPCKILREVVDLGVWDLNMSFIFESSVLGCKIVNSGINTIYDMRNYTSINKEYAMECMNIIVQDELAEGIISIVENKPRCIHGCFGCSPQG